MGDGGGVPGSQVLQQMVKGYALHEGEVIGILSAPRPPNLKRGEGLFSYHHDYIAYSKRN